MGGTKCTYKNCTVKSDRKPHFFCYPVFNKIRCYQWIINAQRYELLDLTVSQLKNRVICQYHFKDEDFMNCQKGQLTKIAVPTEDGPFCDATNWNKEHNNESRLPLITEDIKNEDLPYEERIKNYSIKYADFLTNFEPELLRETNFDSFKLDKEIKLQKIIIEDNAVLSQDKSPLQDQFPVIEQMSSTVNNNNKEDWNEPKITKQEQSTYSLQTHQTSENVQPTYFLDLNCLKYEQSTPYTLQVNQSLDNHQPTTSAFLNEDFQNIVQSTSLRDHNNKVQPLYTIDSNRMKQTCSPSISFDTNEVKRETQTILDSMATDSKEPKSTTNQHLLNNVMSNEKHSVIKVLDDKCTIIVEKRCPKEGTKLDIIPIQPNSKPKELYIINNKKDVSLLKSRMSPNRLAKIEKKKTFNKELVDACIELEKSFQQKLSPKRKIAKFVKCNDQKKEEVNLKYAKKNKTQVSSYLSEDPNLPNLQEYTLKNRLQQMESRLLGKVDQNSQKNQEIKESLKPPPEKKAASTQTNLDINQGSYKKYLYNEISQFLSTNCRSAVYEELFINKFSLNNKNEDNNVSSQVKNKQIRFSN